MNSPGKIQRDILEIVHEEMRMKDRIAAVLKGGPRTIPELAEELGYPSYEVVIWLFAMRRYSEIEPVGRPDLDGYFKYELVVKEPQSEGD
ncbi:MAG: MarR family transcriptional regulator [Chloroflexota bacterium]|nr:MarR family transcriptional regulator [Chloroflexota bacterium]